MITTAPQPEALLGWLEVLADPTRLRLLRLLEREELGVAELCDVLQSPQSTVSRHLKVLLDSQWVRSRRQGTTRLYRGAIEEMNGTARQLWTLSRKQSEDWATARQDNLRLERLLRERQSGSQAFFAGAAAQWDRLRDEFYGSRFTMHALLALLPRQWVVADLGCGTGQLSAELAPNVARVVGVDNSADMLRAARRRVAEFDNVELRRGDLESLPMENAQCDAAVLLLALSYVLQPAAALAEAARILKIGGRIVVVDLLPHDRDDFRRQMGQRSRGFAIDEFETFLREAGFGEIRSQTLASEPGVKGPGLFLAAAVRTVALN